MQAEQPLTENLYREKGKENPGQAGYGGSNARASLAFPTDCQPPQPHRPPRLCPRCCWHAGQPPYQHSGMATNLICMLCIHPFIHSFIHYMLSDP